MDDIKLRIVFIFSLIIAGALLTGSVMYMNATVPREPPGPNAFANTTFYPANQTARVTIAEYHGASQPEGTVKAMSEWTKTGTVYRIKTFEEPIQKGSSVVLGDVYLNSTILLRWYDEDSNDTRALDEDPITPTNWYPL